MMPKEIRHVVSKQRKVRVTKPRIGIENECGFVQARAPVQFFLQLSHTTSCSSNEPTQQDLKGSMESARRSSELSTCVVVGGMPFKRGEAGKFLRSRLNDLLEESRRDQRGRR